MILAVASLTRIKTHIKAPIIKDNHYYCVVPSDPIQSYHLNLNFTLLKKPASHCALFVKLRTKVLTDAVCKNKVHTLFFLIRDQKECNANLCL